MKSGSVAVVRPNSVPLRPLLATRNPSWICLGQAEQALSFAISALRGKRKWSKAVYLEGGERSSGDSVTCSNEACELQEQLDGFLWSWLPDEVMDLVLAWLPLSSFFQMRCVCKKWNNVINTRSFLETYSRVPAQTACFLHLIRVNGVLMAAFHDPIFNHWQRLSLDSIPVNAYIHGGAGGLLCCQRVENGSLVLSVCNPRTRVWRDLLPMPHPHTSTCFLKMVANRKLNSYKVIRVGQLQPLPPGRNNGTRIELCTEVYHSVEGSWRCIYDTPTDVRFIQGCSVCTDSLHCRTSTTRRMLAYGLKQGTWTELSTRNLDSILDAKMVDCEGKPFLVTRVWKGGLMETIDIWGQKQQSFIRDCQDGIEPNLDD